MTGQICPTKRADLWKTKRVFFVTPQVLEKDIQSGEVASVVCISCCYIDSTWLHQLSSFYHNPFLI